MFTFRGNDIYPYIATASTTALNTYRKGEVFSYISPPVVTLITVSVDDVISITAIGQPIRERIVSNTMYIHIDGSLTYRLTHVQRTSFVKAQWVETRPVLLARNDRPILEFVQTRPIMQFVYPTQSRGEGEP